MSDALVDILALSLFCVSVFSVAGMGVLSLPWKDDELVAATRTVRRGWRRLDHALGRLAARVSARTHGPLAAPAVPAEAGTVAFEGPTAA